MASGIDFVASREKRLACPHYQSMSCLLDIGEKACSPDEGQDPTRLLETSASESIWLCCCPEPYKPCRRPEMSETCLAALSEHLAKDKVRSTRAMADALQRARGAMRRDGGEACEALAPEEPLSLCGSEGQPPQDRAFLRQDLFCEMVTWQWEELGDGDPVEFEQHGCPFDAAAQAKDGDARKGFALPRGEL